MTPRASRVLTACAAVVVLAAVNYAIGAKERIRSHGERIYLELAPVDPRSLMQGDYMALRFALADQIQSEASGSVALAIDARGVARIDPNARDTGLRIRYRMRGGLPWIGTNAYFFEEGTAQRYSGARYGEFRIDRASGEALLVGLRDANLKAL